MNLGCSGGSACRTIPTGEPVDLSGQLAAAVELVLLDVLDEVLEVLEVLLLDESVLLLLEVSDVADVEELDDALLFDEPPRLSVL